MENFILQPTSLVFSQADIGFKGVGGKLGLIMPDDIDNTVGFGVVADLGTITPKIFLNGFIDYWGKSYDIGSSDYTFSEFIFGATGKYFFAEEGKFLPYAGAGLALVLGKRSWEYNGPHSAYIDEDGSESDTDIAVIITGGAQTTLSPTLTGFGEVNYTIGGNDFFGIYVGVIYKLTK